MRRQSASDTDDTGTASSSGKPEVVLIKHRVYGLMLDSFTPPGEACFIHGKGRMSLPGIVLAAGKAIEELGTQSRRWCRNALRKRDGEAQQQEKNKKAVVR